MKKKTSILCTLMLCLMVAAFAQNKKATGVVKDTTAKERMVLISTAFGDMKVKLYNATPKHRDNFLRLVQGGFYDSLLFHRVIRTFMIQGGDPLSKDNNPENDGTGDSPYPNVPGEFSDIPFDRGVVGAARKGASPEFAGHAAVTEEQARDTANCQFFITLEAAPQFDEDYTVFGRVIDGIINAEIIMRAPVEEETERPSDRIVVKRITLQPRSKYTTGQPH